MPRLVYIIAVLLTGCASSPRDATGLTEDQRYTAYGKRFGDGYHGVLLAASRIDVRKPIGEYEAYALSSAYFLVGFGSCGGVERVTDRGTAWVASGAEGYSGAPMRPIFVN